MGGASSFGLRADRVIAIPGSGWAMVVSQTLWSPPDDRSMAEAVVAVASVWVIGAGVGLWLAYTSWPAGRRLGWADRVKVLRAVETGELPVDDRLAEPVLELALQVWPDERVGRPRRRWGATIILTVVVLMALGASGSVATLAFGGAAGWMAIGLLSSRGRGRRLAWNARQAEAAARHALGFPPGEPPEPVL